MLQLRNHYELIKRHNELVPIKISFNNSWVSGEITDSKDVMKTWNMINSIPIAKDTTLNIKNIEDKDYEEINGNVVSLSGKKTIFI